MFKDPYFDDADMPRAKRIIDYATSYINNPNGIMWLLRNYRDRTLEADKRNDESAVVFIYNQTKWRIDQVAHFESLGIRKIDTYDWPKSITDFSDIRDYFTDLEDEWKETRKEWIDITDELNRGDIDEILDVGDNMGWFNLNRQYCRNEGNAMGHCGNAGNPQPYDTILSLRKIERKNNRVFSRPSLTFILNTQTGFLGEMKGRANEKPQSKYHQYIIELLLLKVRTSSRDENASEYLIKGIRGGGYAPENNFSLNDLSPALRTKLFLIRPDLKPLKTYYEELGDSPKFIDILKEKLSSNHLFPNNPIEVVETRSGLIVEFKDVWYDWESMFKSIGYRNIPKNLSQYEEYITGEKSLDIEGLEISKDDCEWLFDRSLNNKVVNHRISNYISETYGETVHEYDSIFELLWENNDDIISTLQSAIYSGYEIGMSNQLLEYYEDGITNLNIISYNGCNMNPSFASDTEWYDGHINIKVSLNEILEADSKGELTSDMFEEINDIDGDMTVPYYGFDAYDEEAAQREFIQNLDI